MNQSVKIGIYIVLLIASIWFGRAFYAEYKAGGEIQRSGLNAELEAELNEELGGEDTNAVETVVTNDPPGDTTVVSEVTNEPPAEAVVETEVEGEEGTNVVAATTNAAPPEEAAVVTPKKKPSSKGKMVAYLGLFLVTAICLGLFVAHDISHYMGTKAVKVLFNDEGEGLKNPEYEEAEQDWANGRFLDAIQKMRDYLKKNPREQHVALRIAEIYEKDLQNPLAAALEYEEVLKYRLPDERWGWAAIHLANIYSGKLNRENDAIALLRRIDTEYPNTAAAKKARERLGKVDPEPAVAPEPSAPASNLPKGFRPKK